MLNFSSVQEVADLNKKEDRKLVIFGDKVLDVADFLGKHPGGRKIIEKHLGASIVKPFDDVEHSDTAKNLIGGAKVPQVGCLLDKDLQDKLTIEIDEGYKKSYCCSRKYVIKKLSTDEDPYFFHKTFGLLSLMSYIYRYMYVLPMTGTIGFDGGWFDYLTLAVHMTLSCSSMIFHVLPQRMIKRPIIIWEEYRLHAIVFSLRQVSASLVAGLYPMQGNDWDHVATFCIYMAHHLVVDEITRRLGPKDGSTTVRGKFNEKTGKFSNQYVPGTQYVTLGYGWYQFCLIGSCVLPTARLMDLGFNGLIAIQSSAFLMTLFRKGLIRWYTHMVWYIIALVFSFTVMSQSLPWYFWPKVAFCYNLRVNARWGKYPIWLLYFIVSLPVVEKFIFSQIAEYRENMTTPDLFAFTRPVSV